MSKSPPAKPGKQPMGTKTAPATRKPAASAGKPAAAPKARATRAELRARAASAPRAGTGTITPKQAGTVRQAKSTGMGLKKAGA